MLKGSYSCGHVIVQINSDLKIGQKIPFISGLKNCTFFPFKPLLPISLFTVSCFLGTIIDSEFRSNSNWSEDYSSIPLSFIKM